MLRIPGKKVQARAARPGFVSLGPNIRRFPNTSKASQSHWPVVEPSAARRHHREGRNVHVHVPGSTPIPRFSFRIASRAGLCYNRRTRSPEVAVLPDLSHPQPTIRQRKASPCPGSSETAGVFCAHRESASPCPYWNRCRWHVPAPAAGHLPCDSSASGTNSACSLEPFGRNRRAHRTN